MRSTSIIIVILLLASACAASPRASRFSGERLNDLLERYRGVTIEVTSAKSEYFEGERITLIYHISCSHPQLVPFMSFEIGNGIILVRNDGVRISSGEWLDFGDLDFRETGQKFEGMADISALCASDGANLQFKHLTPGDYTGYFDWGVISPDFWFSILPVPDSLQTRWRAYNDLKMLETTQGRNIDKETLSSITPLGDQFANLPPGSLWRNEALHAAIIAMGHCRSAWLTADEERCRHFLTQMIHEPQQQSRWIITAAMNSLYRNISGDEADDALLKFAQSIGDQKFLKQVLRMKEKSHQLTR